MNERDNQRPTLVKVKDLPRSEQCLKNPQYKCACPFSDEIIRDTALKILRQDLGAYSFINLLDDGVAETYEQRKHQLCQGKMPTLPEKIRRFFSRK